MKKLRSLTLPLIFFLLPLRGAAQAPQTSTGTQPPTTTSTTTPSTQGTDKPASGGAGQDTAKKDGAGPDQGGTSSASIESICVGTTTEIGINTEPHTVDLGDWLTLDVKGFEDLEKSAQVAKKPLQLYLNGLPLAGVPAVYYKACGKETGCLDKPLGYRLLRFHLVRNDDSKDTWALLLSRAGREKRTVEVSVGMAGCAEGCTAISTPMSIQLEVIRPGWLARFVVVMALLLASLLLLAYRTALLHDRGLDSAWSLGRSQMAWWFFFVIGAFLYIWMVTGSYSSLSNSVLALIGISATTAVLAAVIDDNKETQAAQKPDLLAQKAALEAANRTLLANDPAVQANMQPLQQIDAKLAQMPEEQVTTHSFWRDILSDEDGISFHRYQIVIWTLVLTTIFIVRVHVNLAMPDFDGQLLALMGISSGTYLGFKF